MKKYTKDLESLRGAINKCRVDTPYSLQNTFYSMYVYLNLKEIIDTFICIRRIGIASINDILSELCH